MFISPDPHGGWEELIYLSEEQFDTVEEFIGHTENVMASIDDCLKNSEEVARCVDPEGRSSPTESTCNLIWTNTKTIIDEMFIFKHNSTLNAEQIKILSNIDNRMQQCMKKCDKALSQEMQDENEDNKLSMEQNYLAYKVQIAAKHRDVETLDESLKKGWQVDAPVLSTNNQGLGTLAHLAAESDNIRFLELVSKWGANVNQVDAQGATPLLRAIDNRWIEGVHKLIQDGADLKFTYHNQSTCLHWAAATGYFDMVHVLHHASPELLNVPDSQGHTPAHYLARAALQRELIIRGMEFFYRLGANLIIRDNSKNSALDYLPAEESATVIAHLQNIGKNVRLSVDDTLQQIVQWPIELTDIVSAYLFVVLDKKT